MGSIDRNDRTLTTREREVLEYASQGLTNQEIASQLSISRNAVRYHLKEIHSKLRTGSRRERLGFFRDPRVWLGGMGLAKAAGSWASVAGIVTLSTAGAFGVRYAHNAAEGPHLAPNQYCYVGAWMTPAPGYAGPPPPTPGPPVCFDTREAAAAYEQEIGLIRIENVPCENVACPTPWQGGTPAAPTP